MGQRNVLCNHQMLDLKSVQNYDYLHPDHYLRMCNNCDYRNQNFNLMPASAGTTIGFDTLQVTGYHGINSMYGNQYNNIQHWHPLSNDPATVRPEEILEKALNMVHTSQKNYLYKCDQLKSIRQDLTVQRIQNELTVKVYETHARLALEAGDFPEYNQCQSQLKRLYAEGIKGAHIEFSAYNLLCVILHSNNNRDLLSSMARLSDDAKEDGAVKHALAVRSAVSSGNYILVFKLYKAALNLSTCLMDLHVEKMRYEAIKCMSKSHCPTVPVSYIARILSFSTTVLTEETKVKGTDRFECEEWLKAHGACLTVDNNGELQLDTKASATSLYMPEPEDAVAHGDASLAVHDFLTRAS